MDIVGCIRLGNAEFRGFHGLKSQLDGFFQKIFKDWRILFFPNEREFLIFKESHLYLSVSEKSFYEFVPVPSEFKGFKVSADRPIHVLGRDPKQPAKNENQHPFQRRVYVCRR